MKRLNLLHVIPSLDPKAGGVADSVLQMARVNDATLTRAEAVTFDAPEAPFLSAAPLPVTALGQGFLGYHYNPALDSWLQAHVQKFDAVVVHGLWQYHALATWKALHHSRTPYFVYTHGMLDPWFKRQYPLKHLKKSLYWPWADYRVLRDARAVLFTCEEEKLLAPQSFRLFKANSRVVKFGAATPPADAENQRQKFLAAFPQLQNCRCLLFLSRIHPKKGCDLLLRAFADVCKSDASLRLIMAGPDQTDWGATLKALADSLGIAQRIVWTGMLQGELKWGAFRASELFVLPSHQENFGIAVAEALGCGVPVLISDKVNIWREIKQDGAGLTGNDDQQATTANLQRWLQMDPRDRQSMSQNAVRCFQERFTTGQMYHSLVDTIRELIQT